MSLTWWKRYPSTVFFIHGDSHYCDTPRIESQSNSKAFFLRVQIRVLVQAIDWKPIAKAHISHRYSIRLIIPLRFFFFEKRGVLRAYVHLVTQPTSGQPLCQVIGINLTRGGDGDQTTIGSILTAIQGRGVRGLYLQINWSILRIVSGCWCHHRVKGPPTRTE